MERADAPCCAGGVVSVSRSCSSPRRPPRQPLSAWTYAIPSPSAGSAVESETSGLSAHRARGSRHFPFLLSSPCNTTRGQSKTLKAGRGRRYGQLRSLWCPALLTKQPLQPCLAPARVAYALIISLLMVPYSNDPIQPSAQLVRGESTLTKAWAQAEQGDRGYRGL